MPSGFRSTPSRARSPSRSTRRQPSAPLGRSRCPRRVSGLDTGEKATLVISGVDLGILNITHYKTPAPGAYFFGQRRLGLEMRDLYGKLIDGMQGVRGVVRSGGDEGGLEMSGRPLAEMPLAVYSGPLQTDANGNAQVTFTLPAFNGTMRLAAQAWTASKLGSGEKDVIVRDTVVAQATPPKFLMLGDTSNLHLSIENVEAPAGTYKLTAKADGGMEVAGPAERTLTLDLEQAHQPDHRPQGRFGGRWARFLLAHRAWERRHRAQLCHSRSNRQRPMCAAARHEILVSSTGSLGLAPN